MSESIKVAGKETYTKLVHKSDTGEWVVKVYVNGKYDEDKSYYTDDKQDAIDTQKHMNKTMGVTASLPANVKVAKALVKLARELMAGKKVFYTQMNIGKAKYVVNFHDGEKTHKDGSPFYDIQISHNKKDFEAFQEELKKKGYSEER